MPQIEESVRVVVSDTVERRPGQPGKSNVVVRIDGDDVILQVHKDSMKMTMSELAGLMECAMQAQDRAAAYKLPSDDLAEAAE